MDGLITLLLVLQLGSPRHADREQASALLAQLTPPAALLEWGEQHKDQEIAARCKKLLAPARAQAKAVYLASLVPPDFDVPPWLDAMPESWHCGGYDYWWIRDHCMAEARTQVPAKLQGGPWWPEYRVATALFLRWAVENNLATDCELRKLLQVMAVRECHWIKYGGYPP